MSSLKKNILATALVAGLGLTGIAAAYNYGTSVNLTPRIGTVTDLATAEPVAIQQIINETTVYQMQQDIQFIVDEKDEILGRGDPFTFRLELLDQGARFACTPQNIEGVIASAPTLAPVCGVNAPYTASDSRLVKGDQAALADWDFVVESGGAGTNYLIIKAVPRIAAPRGFPSGVVVGVRHAEITNIGELRTIGQVVRGEFLTMSPGEGTIWGRKIVPLLQSVDAFVCTDVEGGEVDKYIDVADDWKENQLPKTRFSWDGRLGSAEDGGSVDSQYIDFGLLTIDTAVSGTSLTFQATDYFTTVIRGGGDDDFAAFDNPGIEDDIYFVAADATCAEGTRLDSGTIVGNTVNFDYYWTTGTPSIGGTVGSRSHSVRLCGFVDTDTIIDDTLLTHTTTWVSRGGLPVAQGTANKTCDVMPLRYNGSTMEVFMLNPATNTIQETFLRLTNRSKTDGWVRLEGIDDSGQAGDSQVSVWVPKGASVQISSPELENGSTKSTGTWGDGAGRWRAIVTAEFPGLVVQSYVRSNNASVLANITDSDTRGEQYNRDATEGDFATTPGQRPSDFRQEYTPDFRGNGRMDTIPGGPNDGAVPTGGTTDECNNPGLEPSFSYPNCDAQASP